MIKAPSSKPYQFPKTAKVVFEGDIFKIYQWPQKMFDGSIKTFERVVQKDSVIVIASVKNKVVMLEQQQPGTPWYYSLPGGGVEEGESPKASAIRELLEETGLKAKKFTLWKTALSKNRVLHRKDIFIAQDCQKITEQNLDRGEKINVTLISFSDFLNTHDHFKYHSPEIHIEMLQAKADPKYRQKLKNALFGTKIDKKTKKSSIVKKSQ